MAAAIPPPPRPLEAPGGEIESASGQPTWRVGTLSYTKAGLLLLFFWLLWNDLCLMLMENVAPQLTPLLLKSYGASDKEIGFIVTSLASGLTLWINPLVSTWSDRCRTPYGRRRPFLLFAAPLCALALAGIPFGGWIAKALGMSAASTAIFITGIIYMLYFVFNSVILAIFSYYFWDVVPGPLLGRFNSLTRVVGSLATFLWSYFLFGLADHYMKAIFVGLAVFFAIMYLLALWQVREGDYPPPEPVPKGGLLTPVKTYFVECFSDPFYLWAFGASAIFQVSNMANVFQIFYLRDELHMSLDTIGKMRAWPSLIVVLLGYLVGMVIDKVNAMRVVAPSLALFGLFNILSFFVLRGPWTLFLVTLWIAIPAFAYTISTSSLVIEIFPREKLGQFCSANTISHQIITMPMAVVAGMVFDWIKDYRYVFIWSATFQLLSAMAYYKVYLNWMKRQGPPRVASVST